MNPSKPSSMRFVSAILLALAFLLPSLANAQINFIKTDYYVAIGDSLSAGEGAMPVTGGFAYQLYDQGVFAKKQQMDFSNISIRAARTHEVLAYQVPQAICITGFQPNVVTITVGGNDFLREFPAPNVIAIAARAADIVNRLVNGFYYPDAVTGVPIHCNGLPNVTVLIANNYAPPHPDPTLANLFDQAAMGFDYFLRVSLGAIGIPSGSRVAVVDLYNAFKGRNGLLLIQKKNGVGPGPFDFDVHPTNAGHSLMAREFKKAWNALPN